MFDRKVVIWYEKQLSVMNAYTSSIPLNNTLLIIAAIFPL